MGVQTQGFAWVDDNKTTYDAHQGGWASTRVGDVLEIQARPLPIFTHDVPATGCMNSAAPALLPTSCRWLHQLCCTCSHAKETWPASQHLLLACHFVGTDVKCNRCVHLILVVTKVSNSCHCTPGRHDPSQEPKRSQRLAERGSTDGQPAHEHCHICAPSLQQPKDRCRRSG